MTRSMKIARLYPLLACLLLSQPPSAAAAAPPTSESVVCGGKRVRVERFFPREEGRRPVVVLLHGLEGMWDNGTFYRAAAGRLTAKGYVVVIVHYLDRTGAKKADLPGLVKSFRDRLENPERGGEVDTTFALWLGAVEAAVADSRDHPRVDPTRVALVGFSMGGFLAASAATRSEHVTCVTSVAGGLPRVLAKRTDKMPPSLLLHSEGDEVVPLRESRLLRDLLAERRRACELVVYKGANHCFVRRDGSVDWVGAWQAERLTLKFLSRHLDAPRPRQADAGQAADVKQAEERIKGVPVGLVIGDKGYYGDELVEAAIPPKKNR
jgi:carboxymethylenebutenolidase